MVLGGTMPSNLAQKEMMEDIQKPSDQHVLLGPGQIKPSVSALEEMTEDIQSPSDQDVLLGRGRANQMHVVSRKKKSVSNFLLILSETL